MANAVWNRNTNASPSSNASQRSWRRRGSSFVNVSAAASISPLRFSEVKRDVKSGANQSSNPVSQSTRRPRSVNVGDTQAKIRSITTKASARVPSRSDNAQANGEEIPTERMTSSSPIASAGCSAGRIRAANSQGRPATGASPARAHANSRI